MARQLNIAVIGLGVGEQHILGYAAHPACRVTAICDIDPDKLAEVGARHPAAARTTDPEQVLCDPAIDVVSIASFDDAHHAQVTAALRAGKHVFVEKPLCLSRAEFDDIYGHLAARPHLRLSSNLILRHSPRFRDLRRRIQAGELGRIYQMEGDYNYGRLHKITSGWRSELPLYSVILGGGVHMLDLMLWLTGARVVDVAAFGSRICTEGTAFRHPDAVLTALRFDNGAIGKLSANFGCVYPHFHRLSIYGTEATFENDVSGGRLFVNRDPGQPPAMVDTAYPGVRKGDALAEFIDDILGCGRSAVPADDVFEAMAVCLAIDESVRIGQTVKVDYAPPLASPK